MSTKFPRSWNTRKYCNGTVIEINKYLKVMEISIVNINIQLCSAL